MRRFILGRLGQAAIVLAVVVTLVFVLAHAAPGDPFWSLDDSTMSLADRAHLRAQWGYDQPLWNQFVRWLRNFATGDFGWSHSQGRPVAAAMRDALPNSLLLVTPALLLGVVGGVVFGTWKAARRGRPLTRLADAATLVVISTPEFIIALAVMSLIAAHWHIAPTSGMVDVVDHDSMPFAGRVADVLAHLMLPATTLALVIAASVSRYQRAAVLSVMQEEFLRTARAKGASERRVLWHHVLRNALGPVIAVSGLLVPGVLAGTVFVEKIFGWPGMGLMIVGAIQGRDYPLIQASVLVTTVVVVGAALLADVAAAVVNPRQRLET